MKKEEINVRREDIRKAFIASVPVMAGYIVLGAGFGIVLETKGLGLIWAVAMSVFIYAASSSFSGKSSFSIKFTCHFCPCML